MKYYLLNINFDGVHEVDHWLNDRKIAPIFYGQSTLNQISSGSNHLIKPVAYIDAKFFVTTFKELNNNAILFSIGDEYLYIFKQKGVLSEIEYYKNDLVKGFEIEIIKKIKINLCPLVLTTIKSNRYMASGTFKLLDGDSYIGNIKALDFLISNKIAEVENYESYFRCLSSLEFETLIAKYLEERGFFVPAYKGGYIRNFDLFCKNISNVDISIGNYTIAKGTTISVQIKLKLDKLNYKKHTEIYFCISSTVDESNVFDYNFLVKEIENLPSTNKWLGLTLNWVKKPQDIL